MYLFRRTILTYNVFPQETETLFYFPTFGRHNFNFFIAKFLALQSRTNPSHSNSLESVTRPSHMKSVVSVHNDSFKWYYSWYVKNNSKFPTITLLIISIYNLVYSIRDSQNISFFGGGVQDLELGQGYLGSCLIWK